MSIVLKKQHGSQNILKANVFVFSMGFFHLLPVKLVGQESVKQDYKTLWQWSEPIENPTYFQEPHSIHLDQDGNLLIADVGVSRIMRFTPQGKYLSDLGFGFGSEERYFDKPRDVAISPNGNIVVTDQKSGRPRVQVFTNKGTFVTRFADEGKEPGRINWPHGLSFDSQSNIYVADVANQRVNKYDTKGNFLMDIGKQSPNAGVLTVPHGLTITPNNAVFVSDYTGTIQKYSSSGEYELAFRNIVHTKGSAFVHTICSDYSGNVYLMVRGIKDFQGTYEESPVEDRSFYIAKYNNTGDYLCTIQLSDKGREVIHATVDEQGKIYALFKGNGSMGVEVLQPTSIK